MKRELCLLALSFVLLVSPIARAQSERSPHRDSNDHEARIVINVWRAADPNALSRDFAVFAVTAAAQMNNWQLHIAYTFKSGYPLSEFWIASDRDRAEDALRLAGLAANGEADRAALVQLVNLFGNIRGWIDARIEDKRNLRLANYYMSASAMDNDELFQRNLSCTTSLMSMLASGRLAEETTCR
jgi:hypothetical protein